MLQEASVTGLVRVIMYILLIYLIIKILSRIFAPILIKSIIKKAESKFGHGFNNQQQTPPKKEGEITIDKIPQQKKSNDTIGEYVDYEEVD